MSEVRPVPAAAAVPLTYALIGNPNCGKSTLFNALTGLRQKVGNYPGVTVEKKVGVCYSQHGRPMQLIDLPGAYSLLARSPDEAILRDVLLGRRADTPRPDRVLCVVDASNLERNLYLVSQVCDLGLPVVVALNMTDLAARAGHTVHAERLERELGVPVIPCRADTRQGLLALRLAMSRADLGRPRFRWSPPPALAPALREVEANLAGAVPEGAREEAALLLLSDAERIEVPGSVALPRAALAIRDRWQETWRREGYDWRGAVVESRYAAIRELCGRVLRRAPGGRSTSDRIDAVLLHPVWGWVALVAVMTALFVGIFALAEAPMGWIDAGIAALAGWLEAALPAGAGRDLLVDGVVGGVGGVLLFLPQILILFGFVGLLESSGYMARAALIMDRVMQRVGLNGRAFIPLLSSCACAIPGILATRTIEDSKERLATILVAPWMSCSARLPVYLLMISVLMPAGEVPLLTRAGILLGLYALGAAGAFGLAWLLKRTFLRGPAPLMILELPPYRPPSLSWVAVHMVERAWMFVRKAGSIILAISIVLWALTVYPRLPDATPEEQLAHSLAGQAGRLIEPAIEPLGFDWRIGVGLIASFAAREVFVSSTAVIFGAGDEADGTTLRQTLLTATWPDGRPLFTPLVCVTLMVFYVFAMQCISTLAVVRRETGSWRWPALQLAMMTGTAWLVCLAVYQTGRALGF